MSTTTDSVMPQMTTITDDILHSPYVSLQSVTARDVQTSTPTAGSSLLSTSTTTTNIGALITVNTVVAHETSLPYNPYFTASSFASRAGSMVVVASERAPNAASTSGPRWDCTKMCGKLNENMECIEHVGCVDTQQTGKGGLGKPASKSSSASPSMDGDATKGSGVVLVLGLVVWVLF